jgi:cation:H+ antiporter
VWIARRNTTAIEQAEFQDMTVEPLGHTGARAWLLSLAAVAVGMVLLVGGASALVHGAVDVARGLGVSEVVIGLTIVAAGTSLPELAASAVAAYRGNDDIAIANVIGSNIFNVLGIVGVAALVRPLAVPAEIVARDNWWMIGLSVLLFPLMRSRMRINRIEGSVLLAVFITYMVVLVRGA